MENDILKTKLGITIDPKNVTLETFFKLQSLVSDKNDDKILIFDKNDDKTLISENLSNIIKSHFPGTYMRHVFYESCSENIAQDIMNKYTLIPKK